AGLAHIELQLAALEEGYVLSDATAYNMQFVDGKPIHIDVFSLEPYEEGKPWSGYNQFCRQFLLPLLIEAWGGVSFQSLYRGSIDGITFDDALAILPNWRLFSSITGFSHVYLHGRSVTAASSDDFKGITRKQPHVSKSSYCAILKQLHSFLSDLKSSNRSASYWKSYAVQNSYSDEMRETKLQFVRKWAEKAKPKLIWDVGGNSGDFSLAAIETSGGSSVVLDNDLDSLETLYSTRTEKGIPILPLKMNLSDPSGDYGWGQAERKGLMSRANADGMLALAVIHHLVIGANLPLKEVLDWFLAIAPTGVIEFVPKEDPMVRQLLAARADVFPDYTEERFRELLKQQCAIKDEYKFADNGRLLISFSRR
ncbi:MAG: class I SAM-dependent methyltransferase, partial [Pseudomonadota bacterium]